MTPATAPEPITRHLRITGRVQGVGYRWTMARGPANAVQALADWARRGPELAHVDAVVVTAVESGELLEWFEQRETV